MAYSVLKNILPPAILNHCLFNYVTIDKETCKGLFHIVLGEFGWMLAMKNNNEFRKFYNNNSYNTNKPLIKPITPKDVKANRKENINHGRVFCIWKYTEFNHIYYHYRKIILGEKLKYKWNTTKEKTNFTITLLFREDYGIVVSKPLNGLIEKVCNSLPREDIYKKKT